MDESALRPLETVPLPDVYEDEALRTALQGEVIVARDDGRADIPQHVVLHEHIPPG